MSALSDLTTDTGKLIATYSDPVVFGQVLLQHKYWSAQEQIMRSVMQHRNTAVKGCNGSGKAYAAADIAFYWFSRYEDGVVIVTSPSAEQLKRVLMAYIHRNVKKTRDLKQYEKVNEMDISISTENYILAMTTNEPERFSGWHGQVLIIADEAPGIAPWYWEAIDGIQAAGDVRVLALGNPTIPGGPFYEAFTTHAATWHPISIDAFETPNLQGLTVADLVAMDEDELDRNPMPQITKRRWVRDMWHRHGEASPVWQSRVRGQFPSQPSDALFPLTWLEAAQRPAPDPGGACIAGIDVAGPGEDETALCVRSGDTVLRQQAWTAADARGWVIDALLPISARLEAIYVDAAGIGHYFVQALADTFGRQRVIPINVGVPSVNPDRWANYKAELYWSFRERLQAGGVHNLADRECFGQASSVRYHPDARGRIVIESKQDVKKRGLPSPDRLEAMLLSFINQPNYRAATPKIGGKRELAVR